MSLSLKFGLNSSETTERVELDPNGPAPLAEEIQAHPEFKFDPMWVPPPGSKPGSRLGSRQGQRMIAPRVEEDPWLPQGWRHVPDGRSELGTGWGKARHPESLTKEEWDGIEITRSY